MRHVWVVEIKLGKKWRPTVAIGIDREQGRDKLESWKSRSIDDEFRLVKYVPSEDKK